MSDVKSLIKMLQSNNPDKRYGACEELRVLSWLPEEAFDALRSATSDSNSDVADAAQRALAFHTERKNESNSNYQNQSQSQSETPLEIIERRNLKIARLVGLLLVLATFVIALTFTSLIMGKAAQQDFLIYFLFFPGGLAFLLEYSPIPILGGDEIEWIMHFALIGWVLYIGLTLSIVRAKTRRRAVVLYFVFLFFLVTNVAGCAAFR